MGPRLPRLFGFELAWADAAFDAFFPGPPDRPEPEYRGLVHGIEPMKPGAFFDDMLDEVPLEPSLGLRVTLWIIALAPLFVLRRFATISSLDVADRQRLLEALVTSRIYAVRQLVAGFKAMGSLLYAQAPAIRRQMNAPAREQLASGSSLVRVKTASPGAQEHAAE